MRRSGRHIILDRAAGTEEARIMLAAQPDPITLDGHLPDGDGSGSGESYVPSISGAAAIATVTFASCT